jgi:hypothetical protein
MIVASLAGKRQILEARLPFLAAGINVFEREGLHGKSGLAATILTATLSALPNLPPQIWGDERLSHWR